MRKTYEKLEEYFSNFNKDEMDLLTSKIFNTYNCEDKIEPYLRWYEIIQNQSKYPDRLTMIFGEKKYTIEDISKHCCEIIQSRINNLKDEIKYYDEEDIEEENYLGLYDGSGHAGLELLENILDVYENLDEETLKIIGDDREDYIDYLEVDMDGGRDYLIGATDITFLAFNYFHYTKKEDIKIDLKPNFDINEIPDIKDTKSYIFQLWKESLSKKVDCFNSTIERLIKEYSEDFEKETELLKSILIKDVDVVIRKHKMKSI